MSSALRFFGVPALFIGVASCATHTAPNTQAAPKTGPEASIYASYDGGMLNRRTDAVFKVDQSAYVMVAHLGGNGRIDVIFPSDASESGYVPGGKWYRTPSFAAYYDAVPQLYSFATTQFRSLGARLDSYDGLGHGYVFMIASKTPMRFDRISDFGMWNDYDVVNYTYSQDPRSAIRTFADMIAGRSNYTLKYANSMGTTSMASAIDQSFDCAYLQSLGFAALASRWLSQMGSFGFTGTDRFLGGCGNRYASMWVASYGPTSQTWELPRTPDGRRKFDRSGFGPRATDTPTLGFNRPTHRVPTTSTSTSTSTATDFSGRERGRRFGPRSGEFGGRDINARPAPRSPTFDSPRYAPGSGAGSASTPRLTPTTAQPIRETHQPTASQRADKPAPDKKPQ